MKSIIENYTILQQVWDEAVKIVRDTETIDRIGGVASQMQTFDCLILGECIL